MGLLKQKTLSKSNWIIINYDSAESTKQSTILKFSLQNPNVHFSWRISLNKILSKARQSEDLPLFAFSGPVDKVRQRSFSWRYSSKILKCLSTAYILTFIIDSEALKKLLVHKFVCVTFSSAEYIAEETDSVIVYLLNLDMISEHIEEIASSR